MLTSPVPAARIGSSAQTRKPWPSEPGPTANSPPSMPTRSAIPLRPLPPDAPGTPGPPAPSSVISISSPVRSEDQPDLRPRAGPACLMVLVNASCTIRYADRSTLAGSVDGWPSMRRCTSVPAARTWSTSAGTEHSPGCGASCGSSAGSRLTTPSSRRISASEARPVVITFSRAVAVRSGCRRNAAAPPCACTTITDMPWATTSCSSRVIRARSAAAASAARWCCSRSRSAARCSSMCRWPRRLRTPSPNASARPSTSIGNRAVPSAPKVRSANHFRSAPTSVGSIAPSWSSAVASGSTQARSTGRPRSSGGSIGLPSGNGSTGGTLSDRSDRRHGRPGGRQPRPAFRRASSTAARFSTGIPSRSTGCGAAATPGTSWLRSGEGAGPVTSVTRLSANTATNRAATAITPERRRSARLASV